MYSLIFDCCERYYDNIAWLFRDECPDGAGCCGLDIGKMNIALKFEIPTLYRNSRDQISKPGNDYCSNDKFDQYALLDFVEFIGQNCKDIAVGSFHSFFAHNHLNILETNDVFKTYRKEINNIFEKTGLLFTLTDHKIIERVIENTPLSGEVESDVARVTEVGTKQLLEEAIVLHKHPHPAARKEAVEKIWDALERLKTYYATLDKKCSAEKIVSDMSNGQAEFAKLFDDEFKVLTAIGNNFRIRHHETNKIDIVDNRHYDYFFNRCLSLISLAIQYLH